MFHRITTTLIAIFCISSNAFCQANTFPEFQGNYPYSDGFKAFIAEHIRYPDDLKEECVQGIVVYRFCVNTHGVVDNFTAIHTPHPALTEEVERVIKLTSGNWTVGEVDGKKSVIYFTLPFSFRIEDAGCPTFSNYYASGKALFDKKNYEKAVVNFEAAHSINCNDKKTYFMLAECYKQLGRRDELCRLIDKVRVLIKYPRDGKGTVVETLRDRYGAYCE